MKISSHIANFLFFCVLLSFQLQADTFTSVQTGDWSQSSTWDRGEVPEEDDDILILSGHTVTINGSAYTHEGNITIRAGGKLIANTGDADEGFTFQGNAFHIYGEFELSPPAKDLIIKEEAIFWAHPTATITVSDDWKIKDESQTIIEGICIEVADDFHIVGKEVSLCGGGGISLGTSSSHNKLRLDKGAKNRQICEGTNIYRGPGANCTTLVRSGSGTKTPIAEDDLDETDMNVALPVYVLSNDDDNEDNDDDEDEDDDEDDDDDDDDDDEEEVLMIWSTGSDGMDGQSDNGGSVSIRTNGTPANFSDDFIEYIPPADFVGTDFFEYIITDREGAYARAVVEITVKALLPVTLVDFSLKPVECEVLVSWTTSSETNNDYFEVERSSDGVHFTSIGMIRGRGTSATLQYYQLKDSKPASRSYYRLRQVDVDGTYSFSEIIGLDNPCPDEEHNSGIVSLYPNPVAVGAVHLKINGASSSDRRLYVTNVRGKVFLSETIDLENKIAEYRLDVSAFPAGTYFVRFDKKTKRFVKLED